ncbi:MAG: hypothetical protein N3A69_16820 [Leptospiraceae bacterium]|nr:hypothetical protein [Leptospiraceae bacterium]
MMRKYKEIICTFIERFKYMLCEIYLYSLWNIKRGKVIYMKKRVELIFFAFASLVFCVNFALALSPNGADLFASTPQRTPTNYTPDSINAFAGNVTEVNIFGYSPTRTWQGYFGNVTGTIQLTDAQSRVMYNWSLASPQGEVYASTNSSILWSKIQCFNFTATGALNNVGSEIAGATNLYGYNLTQLESMFGITFDDVDGVDETFVYFGAPQGHDLFYTANLQFSAGECRSTRIFDSSGSGVDGNFEEVLMYEPTTTSIIFASLLDENQLGFDGATHDFQMMVLENGHGTDTYATPYYFFVELE